METALSVSLGQPSSLPGNVDHVNSIERKNDHLTARFDAKINLGNEIAIVRPSFAWANSECLHCESIELLTDAQSVNRVATGYKLYFNDNDRFARLRVGAC